MILANFPLFIFYHQQEQAKLDANKQATSPDECEDLSPMPPTSAPPVRRRGAFSAEPVTEEDATSYVKKVYICFIKFYYISFHALYNSHFPGCTKRL